MKPSEKRTDFKLSDRKKIADLESRVNNIAEQQIAILERLEKIMLIFSKLAESKVDTHMVCSCGSDMMRMEDKYPSNSEYWECEKCGNTYIPMK